MKYRFFLTGFVTLSILLMSVGCSSDDVGTIDNGVKINEITNIAKSGMWRVTSFIDSGKDETNDFNGYNFNFNDNGTLTADNGSIIINGTWSVTEDIDNSNDDNSNNGPDDIDFNIAFSAPPSFEELTEDWHIVSTSASKIDLIHVSGGNGGTDTLTFQKN